MFSLTGLDIPKHGEPAYPIASYGDGWTEEDHHPYLRNPPTVQEPEVKVAWTENSKPQPLKEVVIENDVARDTTDSPSASLGHR